MTTEDDFQKQLDADPTDWMTRGVLADWLDEHDDPRAAGYRALSMLQVWPNRWSSSDSRMEEEQWLFHDGRGTHGGVPIREGVLPTAWMRVLVPSQDGDACLMILDHDVLGESWYDKDTGTYSTATRRQVEDFAVLGFSKLTPSQQSDILNGIAVFV